MHPTAEHEPLLIKGRALYFTIKVVNLLLILLDRCNHLFDISLKFSKKLFFYLGLVLLQFNDYFISIGILLGKVF